LRGRERPNSAAAISARRRPKAEATAASELEKQIVETRRGGHRTGLGHPRLRAAGAGDNAGADQCAGLTVEMQLDLSATGRRRDRASNELAPLPKSTFFTLV